MVILCFRSHGSTFAPKRWPHCIFWLWDQQLISTTRYQTVACGRQNWKKFLVRSFQSRESCMRTKKRRSTWHVLLRYIREQHTLVPTTWTQGFLIIYLKSLSGLASCAEMAKLISRGKPAVPSVAIASTCSWSSGEKTWWQKGPCTCWIDWSLSDVDCILILILLDDFIRFPLHPNRVFGGFCPKNCWHQPLNVDVNDQANCVIWGRFLASHLGTRLLLSGLGEKAVRRPMTAQLTHRVTI